MPPHNSNAATATLASASALRRPVTAKRCSARAAVSARASSSLSGARSAHNGCSDEVLEVAKVEGSGEAEGEEFDSHRGHQDDVGEEDDEEDDADVIAEAWATARSTTAAVPPPIATLRIRGHSTGSSAIAVEPDEEEIDGSAAVATA